MAEEQPNPAQQIQDLPPEFTNKIPKPVLEYIFSEQTAEGIAGICADFGIQEEERISFVAYVVILLLSEKISLGELIDILQERLGMPSETAEKMALEIDKTVLADVEKIRQEKPQTLPAKKESPAPQIIEQKQRGIKKKIEERKRPRIEKPQLPRADIYRESTE